MDHETLEDHLRKATRQSSARLPEERVFALGCSLARELAAAHGETPPRHPSLEPADVAMLEGTPRLGPGHPGEPGEDLFRLGALLTSLALGRAPEPSWRLDGPPRPDLSTVRRRAVLEALASPRRADRYASAAEALAALEASLATAAAGASSWPMFRGDGGRTGSHAVATEGSGLRHRWLAHVGPVAASPVIAGDLVVAATSDGRIIFLDRPTGRVLETVPIGTAVESSPGVADGSVYTGTDDGAVVALGLADGRERFRAAVGGMVRSSPLPVNGVVIVGTVDAKGQGALVALDEAGRPRWTRKLAAVFSSPTLAGDVVVVGADDGSLHAFDLATGAARWSRRIGSKVRATAIAHGERVTVAAFDGAVASVRAADGTPLWAAALGHSVYSSPCLVAGALAFGCHDGHLHGLDASSGAQRFTCETRGPVLSSPLAVGARIVAASTDGHAYLVDEAGAIVSRLSLPGGATQSSPAADGDEIFLGGARGVHALGLTR